MSMDPRFPATGEAPYMSVLKGDTFFARTFPNYKKMFFDKGSFRPVVHAMLVVGFIGYTLDYFQHLRCACCPPRLSPARPPAPPAARPPSRADAAPPLPPAVERHSYKEKHLGGH